MNMESRDIQQKLAWAKEELGYPPLSQIVPGDMLCNSLPSMASRMTFMRHLTLPDASNHSILRRMADHLCTILSMRAGQEVERSEFDAFVRPWLKTEEGVLWGYKPDKGVLCSGNTCVFGRRWWWLPTPAVPRFNKAGYRAMHELRPGFDPSHRWRASSRIAPWTLASHQGTCRPAA